MAFNYDNPPKLPEDVLPADAEAVYNAQATYRECVEACIAVFKRRGFTALSRDDVSWRGFASSIEDTLQEQVLTELNNLALEGFDLTVRDDDHEAFFEHLYAELKSLPYLREPVSLTADIERDAERLRVGRTV